MSVPFDEAPTLEDLTRLLRANRSPLTAVEAAELARGAAAAPAGEEPDAWMRLVAPDPSPSLRDALARLHARAAAALAGDAGALPIAARLARLREEMARRGLAGFVVPRADEHQGEYV